MISESKALILKQLEQLSKEARGFRERTIPTWSLYLSASPLDASSSAPSQPVWLPQWPLDFHRGFVAASQPVVIRHAFNHWPCVSDPARRWSDAEGGFAYLRQAMQDAPISVAVTPDGRADALAPSSYRDGETVLRLPATKTMQVGALLDVLSAQIETETSRVETQNVENNSNHLVYYCQQQDNNFRDQFHPLHDDIDLEGIEMFNEAFGCAPEVVNIWIGNHLSTTTAHKDHYDNIICQVSGRKTFHLVAPTDSWRLSTRDVSQEQYRLHAAGSLHIDPVDQPEVPWIVDPVESMPAQKWGPLRVTLEPGDALYLPPLWVHAVTQEPGAVCMNINYWYAVSYTHLTLPTN